MTDASIAHGRRARAGALGALFLSTLALALLTSCGITLSSGEEESEVFKSLTLTGDFRPEGEITIRLAYENPYTRKLRVQCDLIDPAGRAASPSLATDTPEPLVRATPTSPPIPRPSPTTEGYVRLVLNQEIAENPEGGAAGRVTPVVGVLEGDFKAPLEPGDYRVRCFTIADQDNEITERFTVAD